MTVDVEVLGQRGGSQCHFGGLYVLRCVDDEEVGEGSHVIGAVPRRDVLVERDQVAEL